MLCNCNMYLHVIVNYQIDAFSIDHIQGFLTKLGYYNNMHNIYNKIYKVMCSLMCQDNVNIEKLLNYIIIEMLRN